jgi:hypothetical protein
MLPHQVRYLKTDHGYYTYHSCSFHLTGNILMLIAVTGEPKDQTGVHGSQNKTLKRHESLRADKLLEIGRSQARGAVALGADKLPEIGRSQAWDASALRADKLPEIGRSQARDAVAKVYNASTSSTVPQN